MYGLRSSGLGDLRDGKLKMGVRNGCSTSERWRGGGTLVARLRWIRGLRVEEKYGLSGRWSGIGLDLCGWTKDELISQVGICSMSSIVCITMYMHMTISFLRCIDKPTK
jgi:hypothetical protein